MPRPLEILDCPTCGLPTEVKARWWVNSTSGPVEMVRLFCLGGCPSYNMPLEGLAQ